MLRVLVVGAGAVGQVFARHLVAGGADVTFLIKPKYADECRRGFVLYPLGRRARAPVSIACPAIASAAEATNVHWDQIYLTVSSTALRGDWLGELAGATGDATIVMLQPSLDDHAYIAEHVAPARIVDGTINFLSYHAPLPGETRFAEPGMAYWLFPGRAPFSGEDARVGAVVAALRAGRLPAKRVPDVHTSNAFPSALLSMFVAALEASDWSFRGMRTGGNARLGARAAAQAIRVVGRALDQRVPFAMRIAARPFALRMVLRIAPRIAPLDLEAYMKVHFTKVSDQMREGLRTYVARGRTTGLDVTAIEQLAQRLIG